MMYKKDVQELPNPNDEAIPLEDGSSDEEDLGLVLSLHKKTSSPGIGRRLSIFSSVQVPQNTTPKAQVGIFKRGPSQVFAASPLRRDSSIGAEECDKILPRFSRYSEQYKRILTYFGGSVRHERSLIKQAIQNHYKSLSIENTPLKETLAPFK